MNFKDVSIYSFQDPSTPIAEGIIDLHNYIFFYLVFVLIFVIAIFIDIFVLNYTSFKYYFSFPLGISYSVNGNWNVFQFPRREWLYFNRINHATNLEIVWTVLPSFILILIAIPSLSLLYSMDEMLYPELTFKVVGYQWYWSYETNNALSIDFLESGVNLKNLDIVTKIGALNFINFDSYMESTSWFVFGHRLLSVDSALVLPVRQHIRVLVTGADVLHSWAVPSFGIKVDAVPGRLNQGVIYIKRSGVFYGQCSELCGVNHGFMPIVVYAVTNNQIDQWVFEKSILFFLEILLLIKVMLTFIEFNVLAYFVFINLSIFIFALFFVLFYSSNFIRLLVNVELMILAVNLNFIMFSFLLDDLVGQIFVIFILAIVASESAIGLAIFISYYRIYNTVLIYNEFSGLHNKKFYFTKLF